MKIPKSEKHGNGFRVRWINSMGTRSTEYFSRKDDADFFAHQKIVEREEVKRGLKSLVIRGVSFSELCTHYLLTDAKNKRSARFDDSIIRVHLKPYFGNTSLANIETKVEAYRAAKHHLSAKTVHNRFPQKNQSNFANDLCFTLILGSLSSYVLRVF